MPLTFQILYERQGIEVRVFDERRRKTQVSAWEALEDRPR